MNEWLAAITTVGFPIVACAGTALFIYQDSKAEREENNKREERFFTQIENFNTTMGEFNTTLKGMNTRLEKIEEKVGI